GVFGVPLRLTTIVLRSPPCGGAACRILRSLMDPFLSNSRKTLPWYSSSTRTLCLSYFPRGREKLFHKRWHLDAKPNKSLVHCAKSKGSFNDCRDLFGWSGPS